MNNVTLIGRLTRDPELRFVAGSGTAVTKFTLAVDRKLSKEKKREMEQQNKPTCDFIRCVAWSKTAEIVSEYTNKGTLIAVNGAIETGNYQGKDGKTVYTTDIRVSNYGGVEILEWKQNDTGMKAKEFEDDFKEMELDEQIPF